MTPLEMRTFLERMFAKMADGNTTPGQMEAFLAPDYVQKVDGKVLDRAGFLAHFRALQATLANSRVTFERFVSDGTSAATVHIVDAVKKSGTQIRLKVVAFYEVENGRIKLVDELTHLLDGSSADRDLGSMLPNGH